jgi:hypothetical protein
MMRRVRFQLEAARHYGIAAPDNYEAWFQDRAEPSDDDAHEKFLVTLADKAADGLVNELIGHADSLLSQPGLPSWSSDGTQTEQTVEVQRIYEDFCLVAPAEKARHLAYILNAGWKATINGKPDVPEHSPQAVLRELVLKSLEVLEFETKTALTS